MALCDWGLAAELVAGISEIELAREGVDLCLTARDPSKLEEAAVAVVKISGRRRPAVFSG